MRVQIVDPPAYTPPYDHALAGALARAGAEVELITCHFPYGPVPEEQGYRVRELFYRRSSRPGIGARRRRLLRAAEHVPDMWRYRRVAEQADLVHYQWLPIPALDRRLLPPKRPRVYTMHWRLPEAGSRIGRSPHPAARRDGRGRGPFRARRRGASRPTSASRPSGCG